MIAQELFKLIRQALGIKPRIRDDGKISIAIYPNDLISICIWHGEGKARRLELIYSTEMNQDREIGGEDWLPAVLDLCTWEQSRKETKP